MMITGEVKHVGALDKCNGAYKSLDGACNVHYS